MSDLALQQMNNLFGNNEDPLPYLDTPPIRLNGQGSFASPSSGTKILILPGSPECNLHISNRADALWISEAIEQRSGEIRRIVDELFSGQSIRLIVTHGPGIQLPHEYGTFRMGNYEGRAGVNIDFTGGGSMLHSISYSTFGGVDGHGLEKCRPNGAVAILIRALREMRKCLDE